ncbi:MAG: proteasome accessory factor PafA2 family protein, partial [Candidatus Nanopelagicales bacterium]|nr:proteasome accessory factor PafA2 family protein [Candidatus Nanopelagicales bacterium]
MSVIRVMGIETEYGISAPGHPDANPILLSSQVVNAYANNALRNAARRARWDYELETPTRDARGFEVAGGGRGDSDADADAGLANAVLTNGARLYVDHAHPEYSTPEVLSPLAAVVHDRAGQEILRRGAQWAAEMPGGFPIRIYKNNTDN